MEINEERYENDNPWLYANYSILLPGLGQIVAGNVLKGLIFFATIVTLILLLVFATFSDYISIGVSIILSLLIFIVYVWNIVDSLKYIKNKLINSSQKQKEKNPWIGVFVSQIVSPLGFFYINKWYLGILALLLLYLLDYLIKNMILNIVINSILAATMYFVVYKLGSNRKAKTNKHIFIICMTAFVLNIFCALNAMYITNNIASTIVFSGSSMEPVLNDNSYILISKYDKHQIERGDIVLYSARLLDKEKNLLHRAIAFDGETVEIINGHIYVNNQIVFEDIQVEEKGNFGVNGNVFVVPKNSIFVLGDNSEKSIDSRFLGAIPKENILGKYKKTILMLPKIYVDLKT